MTMLIIMNRTLRSMTPDQFKEFSDNHGVIEQKILNEETYFILNEFIQT